MKVVTYPSYL